MIDIAALEALVDTEFPVGTFTIEEHEHWLCADAVLSPALPDGIAHPHTPPSPTTWSQAQTGIRRAGTS